MHEKDTQEQVPAGLQVLTEGELAACTGGEIEWHDAEKDPGFVE